MPYSDPSETYILDPSEPPRTPLPPIDPATGVPEGAEPFYDDAGVLCGYAMIHDGALCFARLPSRPVVRYREVRPAKTDRRYMARPGGRDGLIYRESEDNSP